MESWSPENLFWRSQQYLAYGYEHERDDPRFGIWLALSLEQLARSALAAIHPVLLAALTDEQVLHVFGAGVAQPQSIGAAAVFARCAKLLPRFGRAEQEFCRRFAQMRNAALHSAEPSFESTATSDWFGKFVRVATILLESIARSPSDFFPNASLSTVETILSSDIELVRAAIEKRIGLARKGFLSLSEEDQEVRMEMAADGLKNDLTAQCPACGGTGWVDVVVTGELAPEVSESVLIPRFIGRPAAFHCHCCALELDGWDEIEAAGMGTEMVEFDVPIWLDSD